MFFNGIYFEVDNNYITINFKVNTAKLAQKCLIDRIFMLIVNVRCPKWYILLQTALYIK